MSNATVSYDIDKEWPLYCAVHPDGSFRVVEHRHEATHRCRKLPPFEEREKRALIDHAGIHHEIGPALGLEEDLVEARQEIL